MENMKPDELKGLNECWDMGDMLIAMIGFLFRDNFPEDKEVVKKLLREREIGPGKEIDEKTIDDLVEKLYAFN